MSFDAKFAESLGRLQNSLVKSQIINDHVNRVGRNSERDQWAGSKWDSEEIPDNVPNGTNYESPQALAKHLSTIPVEYLESYLQARKSQAAATPNAIGARNEIMSVIKGVTEQTCGRCRGSGRLNKSMCGGCGGHGFFLKAPANAVALAKSIAAKYNADDSAFFKGGSGATGGAQDDADTTPTHLTEYEEEALDHHGEAAFKSDYDDEGYEGDQDGEYSRDDDKEDEDEDEYAKGYARSVHNALNTLVKSNELILKRQRDLFKRQNDIASLVGASTQHQVDITKSLYGQPQQSTRPQPGRGPKAVQSGQVLQKGFVDQAPGSQEGELKYSWEQLKKSAGYMARNKMLADFDVLRMETGRDVPNQLIETVTAFIDQNGPVA